MRGAAWWHFVAAKIVAVFLAVKTIERIHTSGAKRHFTALLVSYFILEGHGTKYFHTLFQPLISTNTAIIIGRFMCLDKAIIIGRFVCLDTAIIIGRFICLDTAIII